MNEITTGILVQDKHIYQLLALQRQNLKKNITMAEMADQGFTTVEHTFEKINAMKEPLSQIVAFQNDHIVGYALSMPISFRSVIPELVPMIDLLDNIEFNGQLLSNYKYYIMGQICVSKSVRGQGVFQKLYQEHAKVFANKYNFIVTEISIHNTRSMRAHEKVGFKVIHEYFDPENNDTWAVVLWDFKKP